MRFSIVVPVYNQEEYIAECLDSLLPQPTDIEVLLIDDGSTDDTPRLCDEYAARNPAVSVIHAKNGGTSAARNLGANAAKGEYLIFIDGDDMLVEGSLGRLDRALREKNDPDIAVCCIDRYIHETREVQPYDGVEGLDDCGDIDELCAEIARRGSSYCISTCRYAIKREFYEKNGLSFDNDIWHEDEHFTPLMLNAAGSFAVCDGGFYLYRRHEGSKLFTASVDNFAEYLRIAQILSETRNAGCSGPEKDELLKTRAEFMFKSGILRGIPLKGRTVAPVKKAAIAAAEADPELLKCFPKLKKLTDILGLKPGMGCFLRLLKLRTLI